MSILFHSGKEHHIQKMLIYIREQLWEARVKIHSLHQHLEVIKGHSIGFIEQMNTLQNIIETKKLHYF